MAAEPGFPWSRSENPEPRDRWARALGFVIGPLSLVHLLRPPRCPARSGAALGQGGFVSFVFHRRSKATLEMQQKDKELGFDGPKCQGLFTLRFKKSESSSLELPQSVRAFVERGVRLV